MKLPFALLLLMMSFSTFAQDFAEATCGEVRKVSNGKILKRLQPSFFGLNSKFVLKTKFENYTKLRSYHFFQDAPVDDAIQERKSVYTAFSDKEKFRTSKQGMKAALKNSTSVWACVGEINIPLKYRGRHAFFSEISLEDAIAKFKKQAKRHQTKPLRITL